MWQPSIVPQNTLDDFTEAFRGDDVSDDVSDDISDDVRGDFLGSECVSIKARGGTHSFRSILCDQSGAAPV